MLRSLVVAAAIAMVGSSAQAALTVVDGVTNPFSNISVYGFPASPNLRFRIEFDPSIPIYSGYIYYYFTQHSTEISTDENGDPTFIHEYPVDYDLGCPLSEGSTCNIDNLVATLVPGRLDIVLTGSNASAAAPKSPCAAVGPNQSMVSCDFYRDGIIVESELVSLAHPDGIAYRLTYGAVDDPEWDLAPTAAPEPATWALMIMGFGAAGAMLRRRRPVAHGA